MGRLLWGALFLSALMLGAMVLADAEVPLEPEEAIQRELNEKVTQQAIEEKIETALARDDVDDARMYADLASRTAPADPYRTNRRASSAAEQPTRHCRTECRGVRDILHHRGGDIASPDLPVRRPPTSPWSATSAISSMKAG